MYCLTNMCYVCLEKNDKSLVNINNSLLVNEDIIHIIGYVPFRLTWMKTKQIIRICEECCRRLRETYQFLIMCHKNSAVMQGYMAKLNTANISDADNGSELRVLLNNTQDDMNKIKCEVKVEDEEIYTFEIGPIIEETEDVFVNVDDAVVKEEDAWKREAEDDEEEPPMGNNSTERSDNETDTEIAVNSDTHDTDTDSDSAGFTSKQVHTTNKKNPNIAAKNSYKCLTCSKSFRWKSRLQIHTRTHTGEKPYKCATCKKCFRDNTDLKRHVRTHTGEKPYECSVCKKCFSDSTPLACHMRTHSDVKPYKCDACEKCFCQRINLQTHMLIHAGEKPYRCSRCNKSFRRKSDLLRHTQKCALCCEEFCSKTGLKSHMLVHADQ